MKYVFILTLILLMGCQTREYEIANHQVYGTEGQIGVAMGSCMQMANSGSNLKTPDKQGRICLLYTSPSPRDGLLSRMPSSA